MRVAAIRSSGSCTWETIVRMEVSILPGIAHNLALSISEITGESMAKRSKKKRLNKSMADSVLEFAESAWPYLERLIFDVVRAMPQLREPPKKKRAKRRAKK